MVNVVHVLYRQRNTNHMVEQCGENAFACLFRQTAPITVEYLVLKYTDKRFNPSEMGLVNTPVSMLPLAGLSTGDISKRSEEAARIEAEKKSCLGRAWIEYVGSEGTVTDPSKVGFVTPSKLSGPLSHGP